MWRATPLSVLMQAESVSDVCRELGLCGKGLAWTPEGNDNQTLVYPDSQTAKRDGTSSNRKGLKVNRNQASVQGLMCGYGINSMPVAPAGFRTPYPMSPAHSSCPRGWTTAFCVHCFLWPIHWLCTFAWRFACPKLGPRPALRYRMKLVIMRWVILRVTCSRFSVLLYHKA